MASNGLRLPLPLLDRILIFLELPAAARFCAAFKLLWNGLTRSDRGDELKLASLVFALAVFEKDRGNLAGWSGPAEVCHRSWRISSFVCSISSSLVGYTRRAASSGDQQTWAVIGLDGAGKTTFIFNCIRRPHNWCVPQIPASEVAKDICGTGAEVALWESPFHLFTQVFLSPAHCHQSFSAVVFVLDLTDKDDERSAEAAKKLLEVLIALDVRVPILLVANKQDLAHTCPPSALLSQLGHAVVKHLSYRPWRIQGCIADCYADRNETQRPAGRVAESPHDTSGGVRKGVEWLVQINRAASSR